MRFHRQHMLRTVAVAGTALAVSAGVASAAFAVYPPNPETNASQTSTVVVAGAPVTFTFGTRAPFTPGSTVTVTSSCETSTGIAFAGPGTVVSAGSDGRAVVTLTFTRGGVCLVTAAGEGPVPGTTTQPSSVSSDTFVDGGGVAISPAVYTSSPRTTTAVHANASSQTLGPVTATARITVTESATSGGSGGGVSATAADGATGATLPKTGASDAGMIAVVGGGLLLAGVGAVVVARRREATSKS